MKIALWGLGILLVMPLGVVAAQQQSTADPVVEAARRTREEKKDQAKAPRVWNNDDIPKTNGVSVVGETPAASAGSSTGDAANGASPTTAAAATPGAAQNGAAAGAAPGTGTGTVAENLAAITAELNAAKEHLKSLQTDLDILQRKFTLDQQMYLGKPEHENDKAGAEQIQDEQDQISAKQLEVADAQAKVDELQAKQAALAPPPLVPNRD